MKAESSDIADYNAHARAAASGNANLKSFKDGFTALISTSAADAKSNTGTSGTGVSIHWLGGEKDADDYADLYDGSWDSGSGVTESGSSYTGLVWTGGSEVGTALLRRRRRAAGRPQRRHACPVLAYGEGIRRIVSPPRNLARAHRCPSRVARLAIADSALVGRRLQKQIPVHRIGFGGWLFSRSSPQCIGQAVVADSARSDISTSLVRRESVQRAVHSDLYRRTPLR